MQPLGRHFLSCTGRLGLPPQEFHKTLKERIATAKNQQDLIDTLDESLKKNKQLKVRVLLDYFRGTRATRHASSQQATSSIDALLPLQQKYPHQVHIALYRTPDMGQLLGRVAPSRWNETVGVQHTKVALFDEQVLLTGANLSHDYFTNRQDRYVLFEDGQLSNYFDMLIERLGQVAYRVEGVASPPSVAANTTVQIVSPTADQRGPDPATNGVAFRKHASNILDDLTRYWYNKMKDHLESTFQTSPLPWAMVVPALQIAPIGIRQDVNLLESILGYLNTTNENWRATLASGYFNLHDTISRQILETTQTDWQLMVAAPKANGFFTAKDVSRHIPAAYSLIERDFLRKVNAFHSNQQQRYVMREYQRANWTFHAKGFWLEPKSSNTSGSMLTTIGSPNFGYRSFERDVEAQAWIYSENTSLYQQWHKEIDHIKHDTCQVSLAELEQRSRHNPRWVPLATKIIRRMM
ncbi:hypothetical protein BDF19DRAFT_431471 [Syncephalis fuscata]|nr:hypothetical protein BDF19DRAFT_431471 [Syncephalis fuscata]